MIDLGTALSIGSSIVGAMGKGKGKGPTDVSGFASLPKDVQNYMLKNLFPRIQGIGDSGYQGIPLRGIGADETDSVFGSKALQGIQRYKDQLAAAKAMQGGAAGMDDGGTGSVETKTDPINGMTYQKGMRSGNKFDPNYYSQEEAQSMAQQGLAGPASGQALSMLQAMQKKPDNSKYAAFAAKRAAQGLPPISPADYLAAGQP